MILPPGTGVQTCLAILQRRGSQHIWEPVNGKAAPTPRGSPGPMYTRPHSRKQMAGSKYGAASASGVLQPWPWQPGLRGLHPGRAQSRHEKTATLLGKQSSEEREAMWLQSGGGGESYAWEQARATFIVWWPNTDGSEAEGGRPQGPRASSGMSPETQGRCL